MKSHRKKNLPQSAAKLAQELLKKKGGGLEELRLHDFPDDESAHDDELTERLYAEFSADVQSVQAELAGLYGAPTRAGTNGDKFVRMNGVFRFAIWKVADKQLFVAAHHEDRGIPIVLWLGIVPK